MELLQYSVLHFNEKDIALAIQNSFIPGLCTEYVDIITGTGEKYMFICLVNPLFLIKLKIKNISYRNYEYVLI